MDAAAMAAIRPQFEALAQGAEDVELDLSKVSFIDSSGIGGIVFLYKRLVAAGRRLTVRGLGGQPLQMFKYLRITDMLAPGAAEAG